MKAFYSLLLLLGLCFTETKAQSSSSEDVLLKQVNNESSYIRQEATSVTEQNQTIRQQTGSNAAILSQRGANNHVIVQQLGAANTLNLTQQGNGNSYEGYFIGSNNQSNVLQDGNNNRLVQDILSDNQKIQVSQLGNNNELIQIENSATAVPVQITQQGNGMNITIHNGHINN